MSDASGVVQRGNLAARSLLNVEASGLANVPVATFFPPGEHRRLRGFMARLGDQRLHRARLELVPKARSALLVDVSARLVPEPRSSPSLRWAITQARPGAGSKPGDDRPAELELRLLRHTQQLDVALRRLELLAAAGRVMLDVTDATDLLGAVCDLLVGKYADFCWADTLTRHGSAGLRVVRGDRLSLERLSRPGAARALDELAAAVVSKLRPVVTMDDTSWVHDAPARLLRVQTLISVPVISPRGVVGALSVASRQHQERYGEGDITFMQDMAGRLGLALEDIRLLEEQTSIASTLQASLLPGQLPYVPGLDLAACYRAAVSPVGGDFYDVVTTPEGHMVLIGDVSGKGTEAATVTAHARHTMTALASIGTPPEQVLSFLNNSLREGPVPERFVTAAMASFVPRRPVAPGQLVSVVTGGHPPALVLRAGGSVEEIGGGGTLIGLLDEAVPAVTATELFPGDTLLLYTDGVTEARGRGGFFGEGRLAGAVRSCVGEGPGDLLATVEQAVLDHSGGNLRDDFTMVAVRVLDHCPPEGP
ncbi:MAG: SpoIIE family protein phosphatase [Acidimicrobiales bacterium]